MERKTIRPAILGLADQYLRAAESRILPSWIDYVFRILWENHEYYGRTYKNDFGVLGELSASMLNGEVTEVVAELIVMGYDGLPPKWLSDGETQLKLLLMATAFDIGSITAMEYECGNPIIDNKKIARIREFQKRLEELLVK